MPDHTDDWMNPPTSSRAWSSAEIEADRRRRPFLIQRQRVIVCSWRGDGPPTRWDEWARFETKAERDKELALLRKEHPAWRLRARELGAFGRVRQPDHIDWP